MIIKYSIVRRIWYLAFLIGIIVNIYLITKTSIHTANTNITTRTTTIATTTRTTTATTTAATENDYHRLELLHDFTDSSSKKIKAATTSTTTTRIKGGTTKSQESQQQSQTKKKGTKDNSNTKTNNNKKKKKNKWHKINNTLYNDNAIDERQFLLPDNNGYGDNDDDCGIDGGDCFSICLLIKDDNELLNEWIAYHYHTLKLRHLIIAIDPSSTILPTEIIDVWRRTFPNLIIEEWHDQQYMPQYFLDGLYHLVPRMIKWQDNATKWENHFKDKQQQKYGNNNNNNNNNSTINSPPLIIDQKELQDGFTKINNHRYRQSKFLRECMVSLKKQKRKWITHIDTDEYIVINPLLRKIGHLANITVPTTTGSKNSIYNFWKAIVALNSFIVNVPCSSMPRVLYGSKIDSNDQIQFTKNYNYTMSNAYNDINNIDMLTHDLIFNKSRFESLRWKYHGKYFLNDGTTYDLKLNGLSKVIVDITGFEYDQLSNKTRVFSIHRPSKFCRRQAQMNMKDTRRYPLSVNHYIGTYERYSSRTDDVRRSKQTYNDKNLLIQYKKDDDFINNWLDSFIDTYGIAKVATVLSNYILNQIKDDNYYTQIVQQQLIYDAKINVKNKILNYQSYRPSYGILSNLHDDSFSACLLLKDDNDILNEWLAYHYHTIKLRTLIVAIDPTSTTTPSTIFNKWRTIVNEHINYNPNHNNYFNIIEWTDKDYMPDFFLKQQYDLVPDLLTSKMNKTKDDDNRTLSFKWFERNVNEDGNNNELGDNEDQRQQQQQQVKQEDNNRMMLESEEEGDDNDDEELEDESSDKDENSIDIEEERIRINNHRFRQKTFLGKCFKHLHEQNKTWVTHIDTDEYIVIHPDIRKKNSWKKINYQNHIGPNTILQFLKHISLLSYDSVNYPCLGMPRLLYGSLEDTTTTTTTTTTNSGSGSGSGSSSGYNFTNTIPSIFDKTKFESVRWKYHSNFDNDTKLNGLPKVVMDLSGVPPTAGLLHENIFSIHRPGVHLCKGKEAIKFSSKLRYPITVNHYLGSWDRYISRNDPRRTLTGYNEKNVRSGKDDDNWITGWIQSFVTIHGIQKASMLLNNYLIDNYDTNMNTNTATNNNTKYYEELLKKRKIKEMEWMEYQKKKEQEEQERNKDLDNNDDEDEEEELLQQYLQNKHNENQKKVQQQQQQNNNNEELKQQQQQQQQNNNNEELKQQQQQQQQQQSSEEAVHNQQQNNNINTVEFIPKPPPPEVQNFNPSIRDSFSACMLYKDDNDILNEWIAYHYHTIGLRYLIVALDSTSITSPKSILDKWSKFDSNMTIEIWDDHMYMPDYFFENAYHKMPRLAKMKRNKFKWLDDINDKELATKYYKKINDHRFRQVTFLSKCSKKLKEQNKTWMIHIDTDEYIVLNPILRSKQKILNKPIDVSNYKPFSILNILNEFTKPMWQWFNYPCISMPRLLYGSTTDTNDDDDDDDETKNINSKFNISRFESLRWKYHASYNDTDKNKQPKVIMDVSAIPNDEKMFIDERVFSIHRPSQNLCRNQGQMDFNYIEYFPFTVNHYLGTYERFTSRDDPRRNQRLYDAKAHVQDGKDDNWIDNWLAGFIHQHGIEKVSYLLNDYVVQN